jgi:hypothetical protein
MATSLRRIGQRRVRSAERVPCRVRSRDPEVGGSSDPDTLAGRGAEAWREEAHERFAALGLAPELWPLTLVHS